MDNAKALHITTIHPRRDTRIFYRECLSIKKLGYHTMLIVADGIGHEMYEGIQILDLGKRKNRISGFFQNNKEIFRLVKKLNPKIVHFHDPELIFVGSRIASSSTLNCKVVFDIHENIPSQIMDKPYLPKAVRGPISFVYKLIENMYLKKFHFGTGRRFLHSKVWVKRNIHLNNS